MRKRTYIVCASHSAYSDIPLFFFSRTVVMAYRTIPAYFHLCWAGHMLIRYFNTARHEANPCHMHRDTRCKLCSETASVCLFGVKCSECSWGCGGGTFWWRGISQDRKMEKYGCEVYKHCDSVCPFVWAWLFWRRLQLWILTNFSTLLAVS